MHYLYYQAIEAARAYRMTEVEREEQLIRRVYGNIHLEQPAVTKEMVRELVTKHRRQEKPMGLLPEDDATGIQSPGPK